MAQQVATRRRGRPFFGWYVVGAGFVSFLFSFGFIYSFGIFAKPIADTIHYDAEGVTALFSLSYTIYLLAGVPAGLLVDRIGPRRVVAAGGVLMGLGLIAASRSTTNLQISAAFAIGVGLGLACIYVPATEVVEAWFVRGRAYATGITVAGLSAGNLLVPIVATEAILHFGVRDALGGFGLALLIAVPAASLLMIARPEALGLHPDGDAESSRRVIEVEAEGFTLREALHSRSFWHLYLAILVASFAIFLPFAHLDGYALRRGASPEVGSLLVSLIGLGGLVGLLGFGRLADRLNPRLMLLGAFLGLASGMVIWLFSQSAFPLGIFALLFGLCYVANSAVEPAVAVDYFGEKHSGAILGLLFTAAAPGSLLGPTLAGEVFDRTGSYSLAILCGAILFAIAAATLVSLPNPPTVFAE